MPPHIALAHKLWKEFLRAKDNVIDATCGNGKDTLALAQILFSQSEESLLIGLDIQSKALEQTRSLLTAHLTSRQLKRISLYESSHSAFPSLAYQVPIRLIVYNFGYLPGGDKSLTTMTASSVESFKNALELLAPGGAISAICYPGHPEGAKEQSALVALVQNLPSAHWDVLLHTWPNRSQFPTFLFIIKNSSSTMCR